MACGCACVGSAKSRRRSVNAISLFPKYSIRFTRPRWIWAGDKHELIAGAIFLAIKPHASALVLVLCATSFSERTPPAAPIFGGRLFTADRIHRPGKWRIVPTSRQYNSPGASAVAWSGRFGLGIIRNVYHFRPFSQRCKWAQSNSYWVELYAFSFSLSLRSAHVLFF